MSRRQQPGLACESCRKRKARCDRVRPQCGTCAGSHTTCVVIDQRPQRGPKKGLLSALRTKVATLERQLVTGQPDYAEAELDVFNAGNAALGSDNFEEMEQSMNLNIEANTMPRMDESEEDMPNYSDTASLSSDVPVDNGWQCSDLGSPGYLTSGKQFTPHTILHPEFLDLSDLVHADLDQLYFDRVHDVAPIIHKQRYFAWAGQKNPSPARACLRLAMRANAAAVSSQFQSLSDSLYTKSRQMLENLDGSEDGFPWTTVKIQLEEIQAWLLLGHFEFLRMRGDRASLTAGRAFRLVQLLRLYDIDTPHGSPLAMSPAVPEKSFVEAEEKRRTFWLAYGFDRFLSLTNEWPLTLCEESICTRLPAPETNFQNNQPIQTDFLLEEIAKSGRSTLSSFAECMVLATLYGRCMAHKRRALTDDFCSNESRGFWIRHEQLATVIEKRTKLLQQNSPPTSTLLGRDPMLAFTHALANSAIIYLSGTTENTPWQTLEHQFTVLSYRQRAQQAAIDMVRLAKDVPRLSCFKVHPFLPSALYCAASFLKIYAKTPDFASQNNCENNYLEQLLGALRNLRDINILAQGFLDKLEELPGKSYWDMLLPY